MEFIYEIPNNLSPEKCEEIIRRFEESDEKTEGIVYSTGPLDMKTKVSVDLMISGRPGWDDIDDYLCIQLKEGFKQYREYMKDFVAIDEVFSRVKDHGYQIQRTEKGGYYSWHCDSVPSESRVITFIWYLNSRDPMIEGGGTSFHNGKHITPEQGKLLFFPATWTYMHMGTPVITDKNKYICTGWICEY
jgi:Rps23 Pro-64 3,4-dihydroxylase Tpa1-like proline 4-hydroxylase